MSREYPVQSILAVGAVVICEDRLLLVRRGSEPNKGRWTVPGGVVELGETVIDAILRETKEECGLEVEIEEERPINVIDAIRLSDNGRPDYHYVVLFFLGRPRVGRLKAGSDVEETKWIRFRDIVKYDLTSGFREFFEKHECKLQYWWAFNKDEDWL